MLLIVEVIMTELSVRTLLTSESHVEAAATTCYTWHCAKRMHVSHCWAKCKHHSTKWMPKSIPETNVAEMAMVIKVTW